MGSMRSVRKKFRKEVLQVVSTGDGNIETLKRLADGYFGRDVGYEVLIQTFLGNEIGNALAQLRTEGLVESVGRQWKLSENLTHDDATMIVHRTMKSVRGRLRSAARLSHNHGMIEDAVKAKQMMLLAADKPQETESENLNPHVMA